jgi:hypothetical protein
MARYSTASAHETITSLSNQCRWRVHGSLDRTNHGLYHRFCQSGKECPTASPRIFS